MIFEAADIRLLFIPLLLILFVSIVALIALSLDMFGCYIIFAGDERW